MTNREILRMPRDQLNELDRQRQFLLQTESIAVPCPACKTSINAFQAAGITVDEYDFSHIGYAYRCPACSAELEQVIPFVSCGTPWLWQLKDSWLQEQLEKARAFDTQNRESRETRLD